MNLLFTLLIGTFLAQASDLPQNALYEKAELARKESRTDDSLRLFKKAREATPHHLPSHLGYQKLLQSQGKDAQLVKEYSKLLDVRPEPLYYYLLGRVLLDPMKEEALYRKGLEMDPEHFELRVALAWSLRRQLKFQDAEKAYLDAMKLRPEASAPHSAYRRLLEDMGREKSLPEFYRELLEKHPKDYRFHLLYGYALVAANRLDESLKPFEKADSLAPENVDVLRSMAIYYAKKNQNVRALHYLERAGKIDPYDTTILYMSGLLQMTGNNDVSALERVREATRLEPASAQNLGYLAVAHLMLKDYEAAQKCYQRSVHLDPSSHNSIFNLGTCYLSLGKYHQGIQEIRRAISIYSESATYFTTLAQAYKVTHEGKLARDALEKARPLRSRTDFTLVNAGENLELASPKLSRSFQLELSGRALVFEGRFEKARKTLAEAISENPENFLAHWSLARVEHRLGKLESSLKAYRRLHELCTSLDKYRHQEPTIALCIAECLYDLDRMEESMEAFRSLKNRSQEIPDSLFLPSMLKALESATESSEVFQLEGLRIADCAEENFCAPRSLSAVLGYWGIEIGVEDLASQLLISKDGVNLHETMQYLASIDEVASHCFTARTRQLKFLLKQRIPVLIIYRVLHDAEYWKHVSIIKGFDDRLGVFLLEDSNWFAGMDRLPYERVEGRAAIVLGLPEKMRSIESSLPDREYYRHFNLGSHLLHEKNDSRGALKEYDAAIDLRGDDYWAYYFRGIARANSLKRLQAALGDFETSAGFPAANPQVHARLGGLYALMGDGERAREEFGRAITKEPCYWKGYALRCELNMQARAYKRALPDVEMLVRLKPKTADFWLWRGIVLTKTEGDRKQAIRSLVQATRLNGRPICYWHLAMLYLETGDAERGNAALKTYRSLKDEAER